MKALTSLLTAGLLSLTLSGCFGDDPAIEQIDHFIAEQKVDKQDAQWKTRLTKPEPVAFSEGKDYYWELQTNKGPLTIKLMPEVAPMHVTSTIYLTRLGFYDNLTFHRVIPPVHGPGR